MRVYCLKKTAPNGDVFYETPELKYFSGRLSKALLYEDIEDVTGDMEYHLERDKTYAEWIKKTRNEDFIPPKYEVAVVEIKEVEAIEKEK